MHVTDSMRALYVSVCLRVYGCGCDIPIHSYIHSYICMFIQHNTKLIVTTKHNIQSNQMCASLCVGSPLEWYSIMSHVHTSCTLRSVYLQSKANRYTYASHLIKKKSAHGQTYRFTVLSQHYTQVGLTKLWRQKWRTIESGYRVSACCHR